MHTKLSFWIALFALLFGPLLLPHFRLLYFAPYLVFCFYRFPFFSALIRAFFAGLIMDLLSSTPFFGIHAVNYTLVSFLLYRQNRNFFEEKVFTLAIMTFFFSILSTIIAWISLLIFGQKIFISISSFLKDGLMMPFFDGLYALLFYSLPFQLTGKISKMRIFRNIKRALTKR